MRDWAREEPARPAPHRYAARIYEDMGSLSQAVESAQREVSAAPADASAWERLGRLRLRVFDRAGARDALEQARRLGPTEQGLLDLALVAHLVSDIGTEVSACEQATQLAPESPVAWSRLAHALARTDRLTDCLAACERSLALADDPEVRNLREQVLAAAPRELGARAGSGSGGDRAGRPTTGRGAAWPDNPALHVAAGSATLTALAVQRRRPRSRPSTCDAHSRVVASARRSAAATRRLGRARRSRAGSSPHGIVASPPHPRSRRSRRVTGGSQSGTRLMRVRAARGGARQPVRATGHAPRVAGCRVYEAISPAQVSVEPGAAPPLALIDRRRSPRGCARSATSGGRRRGLVLDERRPGHCWIWPPTRPPMSSSSSARGARARDSSATATWPR